MREGNWLGDTAEREVLGRCPSCAVRAHRCEGDCNCPVLRCVDVQRVAQENVVAQYRHAATDWAVGLGLGRGRG